MKEKAYIQATEIALTALEQSPFVPNSLSTFIRGVIDAQNSYIPTIPKIPSSTVSREEFLAGKPLYTAPLFIYDAEVTAKIFGKIVALLTKDATYTNFAMELRKAIEEGRYVLAEGFTAYLSSNASFFEEWNRTFKLQSTMLLFLIQSSLAPSLEAFAQAIIQEYTIEGFTETYCPCCGSEPLIGYWKESVGKQFSICSFCSTEYRSARLQCSYCGEDSHEKISYISAEEMPSIHLQVCSTCNTYMKILDRKAQTENFLPAIDDVSTLVLDVVAQQKGYIRPVLSAWGF